MHRFDRNIAARAIIACVSLACVSATAFADDGDDQALREVISNANSTIQGEVLKGSATDKAVNEGIASNHAQFDVQQQAVDIKQNAQQPSTMCQTMDTAGAMGAGPLKSRVRAAGAQRTVMARVLSNTSAAQSIEASFKASSDSFCSPEEALIKVCSPTTVAAYKTYAGADQNALYLFLTPTGGDTYEGTATTGQVDAVNLYIARVVGGGAQPEAHRASSRAAYDKNPAARTYVEMQRRYQAFKSMVAFSLNQIKETRTPAK